MADWYASSAAYANVATFVASHAYSVGDFVRASTTPNVDSYYVFRCTTAGTSSTEPNWRASAPSDNSTVTTGGATFTNVTGQSTYGWSAAAGTIYCLSNSSSGGGRLSTGDRLFASSDHTETITGSNVYSFATTSWGLVSLISVSRAGSVPPVAVDITPGATIIDSNSNVTLDACCTQYWQGFTFAPTGSSIIFNASFLRIIYLKDCALWLNNSGAGSHIQSNNGARVIWDNTTVQFNNSSQSIGGNSGWPLDLQWRNTPSAIVGATLPTNLFVACPSGSLLATCRGVDLSALTTTLYNASQQMFSKILLDSCRIASGLTRNGASLNNGGDEVELVNCYNGSVILSERYQPCGSLTTETTITLSGGATDNVGTYSHKMVSNTNIDKFANTLDSFWMDVNNTSTGSSKTATVEIISSTTLNNDEISLWLEYEGTSGSSLASWANSFIATPLTSPSAVTSSTATWNSSPSTPQKQKLQVTFTPQQAGRLRGQVRLGKASTTVYINPVITVT